MHTFTNMARDRMAFFGIKEHELEMVIAAPETEKSGTTPNSFILSRKLNGRTITAICDGNSKSSGGVKAVITCYIPDNEWDTFQHRERSLTAHANDRMKELNLTPADLDFMIDNADKVSLDDDRSKSRRHHIVYKNRYLVVVTDYARTEIITVYPKDTLWKLNESIKNSAVDKTYDEIIAGLNSKLNAAQTEAKIERERADQAEKRERAWREWYLKAPAPALLSA